MHVAYWKCNSGIMLNVYIFMKINTEVCSRYFFFLLKFTFNIIKDKTFVPLLNNIVRHYNCASKENTDGV